MGAYRAEAEVAHALISAWRSLVTVTRGFEPLEINNWSFWRNNALDHDVSFIFLCFAGFLVFLLSFFRFFLKRTYSNSKSCNKFYDAISKTKVNMKKTW